MYAYIEGKIDTVSSDKIVLDHDGTGYEIMMPVSDLSAVAGHRERLRIYTYYHVSENGVFLYGFLERETKDLFLMLISVNGVGPRAALSILGVLSADDLKYAIIGEDVKAISAANGIGPKTAKRIILDLKDKLDFEEVLHISDGTPAAKTPSAKDDAVAALVALGYSSSEVLMVLSDMDIEEDMTAEILIRMALSRL